MEQDFTSTPITSTSTNNYSPHLILLSRAPPTYPIVSSLLTATTTSTNKTLLPLSMEKKSRRAIGEWTSAEIFHLRVGHVKYGNNWNQIFAHFSFPGRTPVDLKDKWENLTQNNNNNTKIISSLNNDDIEPYSPIIKNTRNKSTTTNGLVNHHSTPVINTAPVLLSTSATTNNTNNNGYQTPTPMLLPLKPNYQQQPLYNFEPWSNISREKTHLESTLYLVRELVRANEKYHQLLNEESSSNDDDGDGDENDSIFADSSSSSGSNTSSPYHEEQDSGLKIKLENACFIISHIVNDMTNIMDGDIDSTNMMNEKMINFSIYKVILAIWSSRLEIQCSILNEFVLSKLFHIKKCLLLAMSSSTSTNSYLASSTISATTTNKSLNYNQHEFGDDMVQQLQQQLQQLWVSLYRRLENSHQNSDLEWNLLSPIIYGLAYSLDSGSMLEIALQEAFSSSSSDKHHGGSIQIAQQACCALCHRWWERFGKDLDYSHATSKMCLSLAMLCKKCNDVGNDDDLFGRIIKMLM
jgi:hypothetical protein